MLPNMYRISRKACNSALILPPVGKHFSDAEKQQINNWAKEEKLHAHSEGSGVYIIAAASANILNVIPRPVTKKETTRAKNREEFDDRYEARTTEQKKEYVGSPARQWIENTFGPEFANDYNKNALARFLEGEDKKFQGLASHRWLDGMTKLGIPIENPDYLQAIKKAYNYHAKIFS